MAEGSNPFERTHDPPAGTACGGWHGLEPDPDGREDVCKTSGVRFDSASGLEIRPSRTVWRQWIRSLALIRRARLWDGGEQDVRRGRQSGAARGEAEGFDRGQFQPGQRHG